MKKPKPILGITELSKEAGVPVSTIKFYIRKELLPKPIKTSKTIGYYTQMHLERLRLVKRIQKERRLPLDRIRQIIEREHEGVQEEELDPGGASQKRKEFVIDTAGELFREKGYEGTTITDIVRVARIGRDTFYSHFRSKKELFIECFRKIFYDHLQDAEKEIKGETDIFTIMRKRSLAFYRAYPKWSDMMNLLRGATANHREDFEDELAEVVQMYVDSIRNEIEAAIQQRVFRQRDSTLLAVICLGIIDYLCYYSLRGRSKADFQEVIETGLEILRHGMEMRSPPSPSTKTTGGL